MRVLDLEYVHFHVTGNAGIADRAAIAIVQYRALIIPVYMDG